MYCIQKLYMYEYIVQGILCVADSKVHFKMLMCFDDDERGDVLADWIADKFSKGAVPKSPIDERVSTRHCTQFVFLKYNKSLYKSVSCINVCDQQT